ncbi:hypothetical protein HYC85_025669 [Camellia sinensis]|uniref:Aminotransferase class I/classII domain-containing protein n=1 Tax=Camellia sinensis TaxID=4442 RepID=A0A7J7GBN2_CAMSI|nr:hypothetical protein HYC85_025669 [Camellia sinensis]
MAAARACLFWEIDKLCDEWVPESLIPPITEEMLYEPPVLERFVTIAKTFLLTGFMLHSAAGPHTMINGKEVVNFASANYLGFVGHEKLIESCTFALEKYGVGSCGPRGFYGTIDVHLDCEARIAKGKGVHWGIQNGLFLSGSTIVYFNHNDMESLQSTLEKATVENKRAKQLRRYIVVKAVYQNSGQIAPLDCSGKYMIPHK